MTALPIVERELSVTARRRSTYRLRFLGGLAALAVWGCLGVATARAPSAVQRAQVIFIAQGVMALGFSLLAGVFLTADCLSEEKREGTIGLLFLTDLKGYDVVLGKLAATSLHAFYSLLAVLPVLALPLLMGGVTPGEFGRVALVLVATLFLTLSLGVLVSAVSRETRQAMAGTLLAVLALAGLLPVLWWLHSIVFGRGTLDILLWACPPQAFRSAFDVYYATRSGAHDYWASLAVILSMGAGALVGACVLLPRAWQEKGQTGSTNGRPGLWHEVRFGSVTSRRRSRWRLEQNPYYWLTCRDRMPQLLAWGVLSPLFVIWLGFLPGCFSRNFTTRDTAFVVAMFMGYGLHLTLKYLIAVEATRRFSDDRRSGALGLVLGTPLPPGALVAGQRRSLSRFFNGPMLLLLLVNLGLLWLIAGPNPMRMGSGERPIFCTIYVGGAAMLLLDAAALKRVGMWMGLSARRHHRAVLGTLGRVMLVPWLCVLVFIFMAMARVGLSQADVEVCILLWFLIGLVNDLIVIAHAEANLRHSFRRTALSVGAGAEARPASQERSPSPQYI